MVYLPATGAGCLTTNLKVGLSRPLINLGGPGEGRHRQRLPPGVKRPKGWLDKLPKPVHADGCVLIRPGTRPAGWQAFKGYFLALTGGLDRGRHFQYYRDGEDTWAGQSPATSTAGGTSPACRMPAMGGIYLYVEQPIQRKNQVDSRPSRFRGINYTNGESQIAKPGSWATSLPAPGSGDVRNGVAGNVLGNEGRSRSILGRSSSHRATPSARGRPGHQSSWRTSSIPPASGRASSTTSRREPRQLLPERELRPGAGQVRPACRRNSDPRQGDPARRLAPPAEGPAAPLRLRSLDHGHLRERFPHRRLLLPLGPRAAAGARPPEHHLVG